MRIRLGRWLIVLEVRGRCLHDVVGICPRCYPTESRTLRNLKLNLAIAWLMRISVPDGLANAGVSELRGMARHALKAIADLNEWPR